MRLEITIRESKFLFSDVYSSDEHIDKYQVALLLEEDITAFIEEIGGIKNFILQNCDVDWVN